jgi:hypothetical protein
MACDWLEPRWLLATVSWITNGDGNWSVGSNWSTGTVPGANDTVVIDVPGNNNVNVTYNAAAALSINNLQNTEKLIIANANGATWTGGTWDGNGFVQINFGSKLVISGSSDKIMKDGQSLRNMGSVTLGGTGNIVGQVGASIVNSGTFTCTSNASITFPSGVGAGIFENDGTFIKTGAGTTTEIGGPQGFTFENSMNSVLNPPTQATPGDCQVQSGTLTLGDDQNVANSYGGTWEISGGATLNFDRGQHNILVLSPPGAPQVIPSVTGAGRLEVSGGSVQIFGTVAVHQIDVSAGSLLLQQNMAQPAGSPEQDTTPVTAAGTADIFNLTGGTFGGNGAGTFTQMNIKVERPCLIVGTTFNWTGGTLSGSGRIEDIASSSSTISTAAPKAMNGGFCLDLVSPGATSPAQTIWTGSGTITMNGDSVIFVHHNATFWDQGNGTLIQGTVDALGGNVWNSATVLKQNGTGVTSFGAGIAFANDENPLNFVTAATPELADNIPSDSFNGFLAKLDIRTGTFSLGGSSVNRNNYLIHPGATLSFDGGIHNAVTYTDSNGVFNGSIENVGVGGSVNFGDGATFNGDPGALLDVTHATFGTGTYTFMDTAQGAQTVGTAVFTGGATGVIGGAGALEVQTSLLWNSGTFNGDGSGTSNLLIDSGAVCTIPSGDRQTTNLYSINNRGKIQWTTAPGLLDINGNYIQTSTGTLVSSIVADFDSLDRLQVSGNVTLDGHLTMDLASGTPVNGQVYTLINHTGVTPIAGTFIGIPQGTILTLGGHAFLVSYTGGDGNDLTLTAIDIPVMTIASPDPITEGNVGTTPLNFIVSLSEPVAVNVTVHYATASGTATSGSDFVATSGTLTIPAGQLVGSIAVPIIGDTIVEPTETFTLTLSNPFHATLGTPSVATGTILDDDGPPQIALSQTNYIVNENAGMVTIAVVRSNPTIAVTVDYNTADGTALAGTDYTATSGTLSIGIGIVSTTFNVPIIDEGLSQGSKTFTVHLSNPQGGNATIGSANGTVTIVDNDPPPASFSVSSTTVTEPLSGSINAAFTISLSKAPTSNVSVHYSTVNVTATAGSDFIATSGDITLGPDTLSTQVFVPVLSDFLQEPNETFDLILSNPSTGTPLGNATGTGTILNQNVSTVTFDATHPYRYIDSSGSLVTIALRGPGTGTLDYLGQPNNDAKQITLNDTTAASALIDVTSRFPSHMTNITVNGSISQIVAPLVNLQGNLTITGSTHLLRLNDLLGGNVITIGTGTFPSVTAVFADATDATLTSATPLAMVRSINWTDVPTAGVVDVTAPSIGTWLTLGNFSGASMSVAGDMNIMNVRGAMSDATLNVGGNLNVLYAGMMQTSDVFVAVVPGTTTLPTTGTQFTNTTSTLKTLVVARPVAGSFSNSLIAAPVLNNVNFGFADVFNGGVTFGVSGLSVHSIRGHGSLPVNQTDTTLGTANPFSDGDLEIRLATVD